MLASKIVPATRLVGEASTTVNKYRKDQLHYVLATPADRAGSQGIDGDLAQDLSGMSALLHSYRSQGLVADAADQRLLSTFQADFYTYVAGTAAFRSLADRGQTASAGAVVGAGPGDRAFDALKAATAEWQSYNGRLAAAAAASARWAYESGRALVVVILVIALVLGVACAMLMAHQLTSRVKLVIARMAVIQTAFKERLTAALQALATGDLTVKLQATTSPASASSTDELGLIMSQTEHFRSTLLDCYESYNITVANLRSLIGQVTSTADSVGAASLQMSANSEEAGRATGEIAQAIGDVAQGAERQVQMVETARRTAAEVALAIRHSAEQAESTAQVATQARAGRPARRRGGRAGQRGDAVGP